MRKVKASGTVAGRRARFLPVHLEFAETPATTEVTMTLPVSIEDLVAALYCWKGLPLSDLVDPTLMSQLIMEGLLYRYKLFLAARREVAALLPSSPEWERVTQLREAVHRVYGVGVPAPRRELEGVPV